MSAFKKPCMTLSGSQGEKWFFLFGIIVVIGSVLTNFLALRNNLIYSDEGWYLCMLRDLPNDPSLGSRFFLLFKNVFHNNVYLIRVTCWALSLLSCGILSYGLLSLTVHSADRKARLAWWFLIFSTLYYGQLFIVACPSFNYITLNKIAAELGLGFLFIGLSREKAYPFLLLSGFFASFLFPIMATNLSLIPFLVIAICLMSKRERILRNCLFFFMGMVLFALYYCLFVETPSEVLAFFRTNTSDAVSKGDAQYGFLFYLKWMGGTILYLLKCFFVGGILFFGGRLIKRVAASWSELIVWMFIGAFSGCVLLVSYLFIPPTFPFPSRQFGSFYWPNDLWWILLSALLIAMAFDKQYLRKQEVVVILLLTLTPLCLSLGSNMDFYVRQNEYVFLIVPAIVYLTIHYKKSALWRVAFFSIVLLKMGLFAVEARGHNWNGDAFFGKHIPASSIGIDQQINLTQRDVDLLTDFERVVPQGETVLIDSQNWSVVVLKDYKPVSYEFELFRRPAPVIGRTIHNTVEEQGHIWVVGSKYNHTFYDKMEQLEGYRMEIDTLSNNLYYYLTLPEPHFEGINE